MNRQTLLTQWRMGALLWGLCFQIFIAEQITRSAWTIPFSWSQHMVSDLGAVICGGVSPASGLPVCSPWHGVLNISLIVKGLQVGLGALLLRPVLARGRRAQTIHRLLMIASATLLVVGIVPQDRVLLLHVIAAITHLMCGNFALVLLGLSLKQHQESRSVGRASLILGSIALVVNMFLGVGWLLKPAWYTAIGPGTMERIGCYPLPLMLTWLGVHFLLRQDSRSVTGACA